MINLAAALKYQQVRLSNFTYQTIKDPELQEIMKKIRIQKNPELDKEYPKKWPAIVNITMKNGDSFGSKVEYPKGDPENPMTTNEIIDKFHNLVGLKLPSKNRNKLVHQILTLEELREDYRHRLFDR